MTTPNPGRDLTQDVLRVALLFVLLGGALWIVRPFILPTIWAATIVVATWPLMKKLEKIFRGRRAIAVTVMTVALLLILLVPLAFAIGAIISNADNISGWVQGLATWQMPPPPDALDKIPLVGGKLNDLWQAAVAGGPGYLTSRLTPYLSGAAHLLLSSAGSLGAMTVTFLITVLIAAILYANGEAAADGLTRFARSLLGAQGDQLVKLSGAAIRGVALGVVLTAIVQAAFAGVGLFVVGIPFALALTAVCFIFCVAQLGPIVVYLPAIIWIYWSRGGGWGTGFLIYGVFVGAINNFLQPILIKRGAELPLLLVFAGVIGGLLAFGIIGIFVGPVLLAIVYTLSSSWLDAGDGSAKAKAKASETS